MRYSVEFAGGAKSVVELRPRPDAGPGLFGGEVDAAPIALRLALGPGAEFVAVAGDRVVRGLYERTAGGVVLHLGGARIELSVREEVGGGLRAAARRADGVVRAPMPGRVVRVLVAVGDEVAEGQGVAIVEAMKMENEIFAPHAGQVTEVPAVAGRPVESGEPLVVLGTSTRPRTP